MSRALVLLLVIIHIASGTAARAETTVSGDQATGAVVIEGKRTTSGIGGSASNQAPSPPCVEYVLIPDLERLPGDRVVAIPCRENPTTIARVGASLRDQVIRYLPPQMPGTSPPDHALVNVKLVAFSGQSSVTLDATVLGEHVTVWLTPTYTWKWGDGTALTTTRPGRAYPSRAVTHTYRKSCVCTIRLITSWSGSWGFDDGQNFPLAAALTQESSWTLRVRQAPIRLTK